MANLSKIEWCDHTLNAISGCLNDCPYCYARNMVRRFSGDTRYNVSLTDQYRSFPGPGIYKDRTLYELDEPFKEETGGTVAYPFGFEVTFQRHRLKLLDRLKGGSNIFIGAMSDTFGPWVPERWITEIFEQCRLHERNNYMFLTKFPERYMELLPILPLGEHFWYGTTITANRDLGRIDSLPGGANRFLSIEPLLEQLFIPAEDLKGIGWIIIGAETGRRNEKVVPKFEWVKPLVLAADTLGIPVFMKDSMIKIVGEENMRRDKPGIMETRMMSAKREEKEYADCAQCGRRLRRNTMVTLQARVGKHEKNNPSPTKTICAMCRSCYEKWCKYHKLEGYVKELYGEDISNEEEP